MLSSGASAGAVLAVPPCRKFPTQRAGSGRTREGYTARLPDTSKPNPGAAGTTPEPIDPRVEAARYALFGRALPTLRHGLVGELQALRFGVGILRASTQRSEVEATVARLAEQAARSIARADEISRWFQPDPDAAVAVEAAVGECLELVHGQWLMHGIVVSHDVRTDAARVRGWPFRELLLASLVTLGDDLASAADVTVRVRQRGSALWLTIRGDPATREDEGPRNAWPRRLLWEDVDALAKSHSIPLRRTGHRVAARFPVLGPDG